MPERQAAAPAGGRANSTVPMNRTGFSLPPDHYAQLLRDYFAEFNGADAASPPVMREGRNWHVTTQTSRGQVLEKAGISLMHIVDGRIYGSPGSIKLFEALAYPANPRIPGLVFLFNVNETEKAGRSVVLYFDLFFQHGCPDDAIRRQFSGVLQPAYGRHGREFGARFKAEPGRILAGAAAECGVMEFMPEHQADPFASELLHAGLGAYREIVATTGQQKPESADFDAMFRHRARLVQWLTCEDIGIRFALDSGVPLELIEAYGYPPVVRY